MRFKLQDLVLVTGGKDKGKQGKIVKLLPKKDRVVVEGVNLYTKHMKPFGDQPGRKVRVERSLPTANVAIINDKGQPDRIGYQVAANGDKTRIFKKTGKPVSTAASKAAAPVKTAKSETSKSDDQKTAAKKPATKKTTTKKTK